MIAAACACVVAAGGIVRRHWRRIRAVAATPARRRARRLAIAFAATAAGLLAIAGGVPGDATLPAAPAGEVRVSFLDIGQGDATLIELDGTTVLVDTGPPDGPILDRLEEAGVKRLDALMLTHAEADHEGAAPEVIARHKPRLVIDGGAGWASRGAADAPDRGAHGAVAPDDACKRGRRSPSAGCASKCCGRHPSGPTTGDPNDFALVSRLEVGAFSMLLSADAESHVTQALELEPVDVLKVAHHGSADPGLPALLERLTPRLAAIEVGENTYGHPTPSTLAALARTVPKVVRTDTDGTIRLHAVGDRIWIE